MVEQELCVRISTRQTHSVYYCCYLWFLNLANKVRKQGGDLPVQARLESSPAPLELQG